MKNILLILVFVFSSSVFIQTNPADLKEKLDELIIQCIEENNIPGIGFGISFHDGEIIEEYYGFSNLEHDSQVNDNSIFAIGSITKTLTAIAILNLCEENKLNLTDKLSKFFPEFPSSDIITIEELLNHSSGMKDIFEVPEIIEHLYHPWKAIDMIEIMNEFPPNFIHGEKSVYNNTAYIMLGIIIERLSGMSYPDYLNQTILDPLNMNSTMLANDFKIIKNRTSGYIFADGELLNAPYIDVASVFSTGGYYSTVSDMLKLKDILNGNEILNRASVKQMLTPGSNEGLTRSQTSFTNGKTFFGYGNEIIQTDNGIIIGKLGGMVGYTAYYCYLKEENIYFTILFNLGDQNRKILKLSQDIISVLKQ